MAYAFSKAHHVEKAVRHIARARIKASLNALTDPSKPMPVVVHELRKNVKRTRGRLRLVRPVYADFATVNPTLRDAARLLTELREQAVIVATFDRVAQGADLAPPKLAAIRAQRSGHRR